ncbi:MAG TPA: hypothetical protein VI248_28295, partial [Kineosporiaceae bacterium]
ALPGVVGLFGRAPQRATGRAADGRPAGWRGALQVADCRSLGHVSVEDWQAVVSGQVSAAPDSVAPGSAEGEAGAARPARDERRAQRQQSALDKRDERRLLRAHLDGLDGADDGIALRIADHVAVDRWTGGASDSALFTVLEPMGARWEPLTLTLDCRRAGARVADGDRLALALLLLTLRDLATGWLAFGFGATRGTGQIAVSQVRFQGAELDEPWAGLVTAGTLDAVLADPPDDVRRAMDRWAELVAPDVITLTDTEFEEVSR